MAVQPIATDYVDVGQGKFIHKQLYEQVQKIHSEHSNLVQKQQMCEWNIKSMQDKLQDSENNFLQSMSLVGSFENMGIGLDFGSPAFLERVSYLEDKWKKVSRVVFAFRSHQTILFSLAVANYLSILSFQLGLNSKKSMDKRVAQLQEIREKIQTAVWDFAIVKRRVDTDVQMRELVEEQDSMKKRMREVERSREKLKEKKFEMERKLKREMQSAGAPAAAAVPLSMPAAMPAIMPPQFPLALSSSAMEVDPMSMAVIARSLPSI